MRIFLPIIAAAGFLAGPALAYAPQVACELDSHVTRGLMIAEETGSEAGDPLGLSSADLYGQPAG